MSNTSKVKATKTKINQALEDAKILAAEEGIRIPTWKRQACALIASIAVNYAWMTPVISLLATALISVPLWLTIAIWVVAVTVMVRTGVRVGLAVTTFVLSEEISSAVFAKAKGLFKRDELVAA